MSYHHLFTCCIGATPSPVSQASSTGRPLSKRSKEQAEEEAWLDALEAGKLDEYGEIPKPKDESLLTARQVLDLFFVLVCNILHG